MRVEQDEGLQAQSVYACVCMCVCTFVVRKTRVKESTAGKHTDPCTDITSNKVRSSAQTHHLLGCVN